MGGREMIACEICGRGPSPERGGITVYRANEKGVIGIWRCAQHPSKESAQRELEVSEITVALEGKKIQ